MNAFSITDYQCMARALRLAERGLMTTHPNPRVGCILWRDGSVVGEGWHRVAGESHAEVAALDAAGGQAIGATAYVTLEPCAHHGRTGPCSKALIDAGVQRVVAATEDPSPEVGGKGIQALRDAGIRVDVGLMDAAARTLNAGFFSRVVHGRPFVRLKLAASVDGATAMQDGESQWISGEAARRDVQRWRARSDAIVTGIGTVLADNPSLTVRDVSLERAAPLRVVLDSKLRTPPEATVLSDAAATLIFCCDDVRRGALARERVDVLKIPCKNGLTSLPEVLASLASRQINEVLVEAGAVLAGAFLEQGLFDELVIYQAPHIMGSQTRGLALTPAITTLRDRVKLQIVDRRQVGPDTRITARPLSPRGA
ncbi:MAG: bifunctional diaminohydroxyphosphoribosylaminopyrimidine deaminase/5-amino-6-(5-phosphoribosylamino)uracil reductase RibD [Woeseia sp.]|nr:bifunctional diaminohydroxyphosphoribosylaminopyrimidine deaminase/5-amino-6-(5-phosphoribosylamino)uracil reductase RibD [Woeseia sp.]